jgi:hypothetical protein
VVPVRQVFDARRIEDVRGHLERELAANLPAGHDLSGREIAITAGSRGLADIRTVLSTLIDFLRARGARPFLVPAMGSHGGATAEGQGTILEKYGLTTERLGVPVRSSMEVVEVGRSASGLPVYCDRHAAAADGVVAVNRIKDHTDFEGRFESGLVKILVIGLGKREGARTIHRLGVRGLREEIPRSAEVILSRLPVLFGVGIVENAYGRTARLEVIPAAEIMDREPPLLEEAKRLRPRLLVDELDVLVVEEMGKEISGTGLDCNVIGRRRIAGEPEPRSPRCSRVVALSLTPKSRGNAVGIGLADICTRRLVDAIDFDAMYVNTITATFVERGRIPMTMDTDREAIELALKTCWVTDPERVRMAIIRNTKALETIRLSEALLPALRERDDLRVEGTPEPLRFDESGRLEP